MTEPITVHTCHSVTRHRHTRQPILWHYTTTLMLRLNVRDVTRRLTRVNSDGLIVLGGSDTKRFVANWQAMGEVKNIKLDKLSDDLVCNTIIWGSYPGHVSWTVAIILILCLVAVYVVILLYKKQEITAPTLCMKRSIRS